ncbi:MAG: hypothetical protein AAF846_26420 [Chloroflexota bacterium]
MSSPNEQTDQYLEAVLKRRSASVDIPQDEADVVHQLIETYPVVSLSSHKKRQILEKATMLSRKQKRPKRINWLGRVAILLIVAGLGALVSNLVQSDFAMLAPIDEADDIVLNEETPLFDAIPQTSDAFGFEYGAYTPIDDTIPYADDMRNAGMSWVGRYIVYDPSQPEQLVTVTEAINTAHENGFKIMVALQGNPNLYSDEYLDGYVAFAGEIGEAGADALEIWGEANINRSFSEELMQDSTAYATILRNTARVASATNPDMLIIAGGPAPTGAPDAFPRQVINDDVFLESMVDIVTMGRVDCIGMHYLEGILPPLATSGDTRDDYYTRYLPTMLQRYRQVIKADLPICITELGYLSAEGVDDMPVFFEWADDTSRDEQAQWTREALEWLSLQADVRLAMIWHIGIPTIEPGSDGFDLVHPISE